jgi:hypothetical protein
VKKILKQDFYIGVSKIMGIFMIGKIIESIRDLAASLIFLPQMPEATHPWYLIINFLPIIAFSALAFILLRGSKYIGRKLYGKNDYIEDAPAWFDKLDYQRVLRSAFFGIGIFTLVNSIPRFLKALVLIPWGGMRSSTFFANTTETLVSIILGCLLIFCPGLFQKAEGSKKYMECIDK